MSRLGLVKVAAPSTPAANESDIFVDTTDRRLKQIDETGVINTLNHRGMYDRNVLHNGGFAVQQRVATAATQIPAITTSTRAGQVADRWAVTASVATTQAWAQIDSMVAGVETGLLSRFYGSMVATVAGRKVLLSQVVLGDTMAHLRGQKVRVSIKHNQKVGAGQTYNLGLLQLNASGTVDTMPTFLTAPFSVTTGVDPAWGTNLAVIPPDASPTAENGTNGASWCAVTSVAATWTKSSAVFTVPSTAKNLVVVFFSNATGAATDNISVAEAQMTQGPEIVDWVAEPIVIEIIKCQQFFCKSFPLAVVPAASISVATGGHGASWILGKTGSGTVLGSQISITFPVTMRTAPAMTYYTPVGAGAVVYRHSGVTPAVQGTTATVTSSLTQRGVIVSATNEASTNGTIGDLVSVHYSAEADFIT